MGNSEKNKDRTEMSPINGSPLITVVHIGPMLPCLNGH